MENTRGSFSDDLKWNTNDLYRSRDDFERDYALVEKKIKEYEKFKGHVLDDAATLLEMLDLDEEICMMLDREIRNVRLYTIGQLDYTRKLERHLLISYPNLSRKTIRSSKSS